MVMMASGIVVWIRGRYLEVCGYGRWLVCGYGCWLVCEPLGSTRVILGIVGGFMGRAVVSFLGVVNSLPGPTSLCLLREVDAEGAGLEVEFDGSRSHLRCVKGGERMEPFPPLLICPVPREGTFKGRPCTGRNDLSGLSAERNSPRIMTMSRHMSCAISPSKIKHKEALKTSSSVARILLTGRDR
jgi:hypothetical protein